MKQLAALALSLSFASVWAQSQQMDIKPIQEAKDEIRSIIKDFKIESMDSAVESPEYRLAQMVMKRIMEQKQDSLESYLSTVSGRFEKDYAIISNIKLLGDSAATKATVEEAKKRYKARAEDVTPEYQGQMESFVLDGFDPVIKQCLTVLCVNRVAKDIENWTKIMSKVNINLDLGAGAKLKKSAEIKPKDIQKEWTARATRMNSGLELVMTRGSQEFQRLSDPSITLEEAVAYGSKSIQDYGIDNIRKYSLDLLKKHGLALLDQYGAENLTKYTAKQLQTYGTENLRLYGLSLLEKHPLQLLEKLSDDYGIEALTKYGVDNLKDFTPAQIDQFGVDLLRQVGAANLEKLSENNDLDTIRKHGKDLLRFSAQDIEKYGMNLLETFGSDALQTIDDVETLKKVRKEIAIILGPAATVEIANLKDQALMTRLIADLKKHPKINKEFMVAEMAYSKSGSSYRSIESIDIIIFKGNKIENWKRVNEDGIIKATDVKLTKSSWNGTRFREENGRYNCEHLLDEEITFSLANKEFGIKWCPDTNTSETVSQYYKFL